MRLKRALKTKNGPVIAILAIMLFTITGVIYAERVLKTASHTPLQNHITNLRETVSVFPELQSLAIAIDDAKRAGQDPTDPDGVIARAVDIIFARTEGLHRLETADETPGFVDTLSALNALIDKADALLEKDNLKVDEFAAEIVPKMRAAKAILFRTVDQFVTDHRKLLKARISKLREMTLLSGLVLMLLGTICIGSVILIRREKIICDKKEEVERYAHYLALHDSLTGLANRAHFNEVAESLMNHSQMSGERVAVMILDLDKFKVVNDTHGHLIGDALLCTVAERFKGVVDAQYGVAARLGGDEFAAIFPNSGGIQALTKVCDTLMMRIREPLKIESLEIIPSATIGVALQDNNLDCVTKLLKGADRALYKAKDSGRNTYALYDTVLSQSVDEQSAIMRALETAIENGELHLVYQPQICLVDNAVRGFDAIPRWSYGDTTVAASVFLAIANTMGRLIEFEQWIIERAVREAAQWRSSNGKSKQISIKLSPAHLLSPHLVDFVGETLKAHHFPSNLLQLKIDGGTINANNEVINSQIAQLQSMGVKLLIDHFGAAGSSFQCLRRSKINEVKIDSAYVTDIDTSDACRLILSGLLDMASSLQVDVIVDGVDFWEQRQALELMGCAVAQGALFGAPIEAAAAAHLNFVDVAANAVSKVPRLAG